jgi:hypothetical protein
MVRAQAWGLGHSNWMERRCGACWAKLAEQSALERHYGQMPVARSTEQGPLTLLPPALMQALRALEESSAGYIPNMSASRMHPSTRSGRVPVDRHQSPPPASPTSVARANAAVPEQGTQQQHKHQAHKQWEDTARGSTGQPEQSSGSIDAGGGGQNGIGASHQHPRDPISPQHSASGGAGPSGVVGTAPASSKDPTTSKQVGDSNSIQHEVSNAFQTRDFAKLLDLLGPQQVESYLATLEGVTDRPLSPPTQAVHTHSPHHTQLSRATSNPTASHPHYAFARKVAAEEHAAVRARDKQWLDGVGGDNKRVTTCKLTQLVTMPPVGQPPGSPPANAGGIPAAHPTSAGGAGPQQPGPGAAGTGDRVKEAKGNDEQKPRPATAEERRMQWSLSRETRVEEELEKLQEQLVFGVTQK